MLRRLAPSRARAYGRVISHEDAVDLALAYPGVTHAAAWDGAGPSSCACGGRGVHLAFVRAGADGPKPPSAGEIAALRRFLDNRRDSTIPLCVCAGAVTRVALAATLAVDPRRIAATVLDAASRALLDPDGPLAPAARMLGQPLDASDLYPVLHGVPGIVGIESVRLGGAAVDRRPATREELVVLAGAPALQATVPA